MWIMCKIRYWYTNKNLILVVKKGMCDKTHLNQFVIVSSYLVLALDEALVGDSEVYVSIIHIVDELMS